MYLGSNASDFAEKLLGYLQKADYQIAQTSLEKQEIYKLRYDAYLREGAISSNRTLERVCVE